MAGAQKPHNFLADDDKIVIGSANLIPATPLGTPFALRRNQRTCQRPHHLACQRPICGGTRERACAGCNKQRNCSYQRGINKRATTAAMFKTEQRQISFQHNLIYYVVGHRSIPNGYIDTSACTPICENACIYTDLRKCMHISRRVRRVE